jgi:hypothetical protein
MPRPTHLARTASQGGHSRWQEALVFGFIWSIVGAIYGAILVAMLAFFRHFDVGGISIGLAASLAGAVGALFYGGLRLAFLSTVAALIAAFGYLSVFPMQAISPLAMVAVSGTAGVIVGGHYGYLMKGSRVSQATGKALAGLYAGLVAGIPLAAVVGLFGEVPTGVAAATLAPSPASSTCSPSGVSSPSCGTSPRPRGRGPWSGVASLA